MSKRKSPGFAPRFDSRISRIAIVILAFTGFCVTLHSQKLPQSNVVPRLVKFSGSVTDSDGQPRSGTVPVLFSIYDKQDSATALWMETQNVTLDPSGRFTVLLGNATVDGLPASIFDSGDAKWIGVQPEGAAEQPRVSLVSVPYALKAGDAETLGGRPASAYQLAPQHSEAATKETSAAVNTTSGTANSIPLFTDNAGTLGNSLFFQSGGSIGMGRSPVIAGLDVLGGVRANTGLATGARNISDDAINTNALFIDGSNALGLAGTNNLVFGAGSIYSTVSFYASSVERLTVLGSNGNVGISNTNPTAKLDVFQPAAGSLAFSTGTTPPSAVHGDTTATSGFIAGVLGTTSSVDGYGMLGENLSSGAGGGFSAGVRGITANTTTAGTGVWGDALQISGDNVGVYGHSNSTTGTGVQGQADALTGDAVGVYGQTASTTGTGIFGFATSTNGVDASNYPVGVYGRIASTDFGAAGLFDTVAGSSNLLIGRTDGVNVFRVDSTGHGFFNGTATTGGADFAESVDVVDRKSSYEPGDVIAIDTTGVRRFAKVSQPYSTLVAGIYSTKPGVLATQHSTDDPRIASGEIPLAVVGIVPCKVIDENGEINAGDLLVSSSTAGFAMKGTDRNKMTGAVVGKALQAMHSKNGVIEVLVSLQ